MEKTVITHSFFSKLKDTAINISDSLSLAVNYTVFENIIAEKTAAIYYKSKSFEAYGLCIYKCQVTSEFTLACLVIGKVDARFASIAFCGPGKQSGDDVLNFCTGPIFFEHSNISFSNTKQASGLQIMNIDKINEVLIKNVICAEGVSDRVIEYGNNKVGATFDSLITCRNSFSAFFLYWSLEINKNTIFQNCFLETTNDNVPFSSGYNNILTIIFKNTYFCGTNLGNANYDTKGLIKTDKLITPIITAGYHTYLCDGELTNNFNCLRKTNICVRKYFCVSALSLLCSS